MEVEGFETIGARCRWLLDGWGGCMNRESSMSRLGKHEVVKVSLAI